MEPEMKHEGPHKHGKHMHDPKTYWASWCSPVGLGIFIVAVTIAAVIVFHALLSIAMVVGGMHEQRDMKFDMRGGTYPAGMPIQGEAGQMMQQ